ncbi:MAG TPA: hypothetical protein DCG12_05960 [Planctomycetaceae bacterium]|nr:hypothetical protein [Planctomycetaceae bacterium]
MLPKSTDAVSCVSVIVGGCVADESSGLLAVIADKIARRSLTSQVTRLSPAGGSGFDLRESSSQSLPSRVASDAARAKELCLQHRRPKSDTQDDCYQFGCVAHDFSRLGISIAST